MTVKSTNIERFRTQNRKAYSSWAAHNCPAFSAFSDEAVLLKYLSDIGLKVKSVYDETDAAKIRMIASELVLKRDLLEIDEFKHKWVSPEMVSMYYSRTIVFAVMFWIDQGMPYTPREMAGIYDYIISHSLQNVVDELKAQTL